MQLTPNKSVLFLLLVASALFLTIGLVASIITFLTACWNLLKEGQLFLFVVIALLSIILPIFKLALLAKLILSRSTANTNIQKTLGLLHRFGKWSMLDVFVVAILVVVVKLGAIGNVEKHIGLYAYTTAAILIMLLTNMVINYLKQNEI